MRLLETQDPRQRFGVLWETNYDAVFRFTRRRGADPATAEDVVAEVFLVAWRRLGELPAEPRAARPWLLGTARKLLANRRRSEQRTAALHARVADDATTSPASSADSGDAADLAGAFNGLSPSDREAIALVTWEELTPKEAAETLGMTPARFRVRLHRAKKRLRDAVATETSRGRLPAMKTSAAEEV